MYNIIYIYNIGFTRATEGSPYFIQGLDAELQVSISSEALSCGSLAIYFDITVEHLNKGHFGTSHFVHYRPLLGGLKMYYCYGK